MKGKTILIILSLIGFITVGVLLITKMGDIGKLGAAVTYDANGCPVDGKKWTYNKNNNKCYSKIDYSYTCADGYKYSSANDKCYKNAVRNASNYYCANKSDTLVKNLKNVGTYKCVRKRDKKVCSATTSTDGNCYLVKAAVPKEYKITYNANGGTATKNGKSYSSWSETAKYGQNYKTQANWYSRKGYTFVGWNEDKNGNGTDWTNYINKNWKWNYTKNVTLYAQWVKGTNLIKDTNFNRCLVDIYNRSNGTKYSYSHIMTVTELYKFSAVTCSAFIKNISGVEYMKNLQTLDLADVGLKSINLTKNTKLTKLNLGNTYSYGGSNLKTLNLSNNKLLTSISLDNMYIDNGLSFSNNTKLTYLSLGDVDKPNTTGLSLDLSKNVNLKTLIIANTLMNVKLSKLDLTKCTQLDSLKLISISGLTSLNLTKNTKLNKIELKSTGSLKLKTNGKYNLSKSSGRSVYTRAK